MTFKRTLKEVKRLHPKICHEAAVEMAHDWMADAAREREEQSDTDCIQDHMPLEYFTERGDQL